MCNNVQKLCAKYATCDETCRTQQDKSSCQKKTNSGCESQDKSLRPLFSDLKITQYLVLRKHLEKAIFGWAENPKYWRLAFNRAVSSKIIPPSPPAPFGIEEAPLQKTEFSNRKKNATAHDDDDDDQGSVFVPLFFPSAFSWRGEGRPGATQRSRPDCHQATVAAP